MVLWNKLIHLVEFYKSILMQMLQSDWLSYSYTVEPQFNEPLYNKVLDITNDIPPPQ